jgi:hypothetical protein
MRHNLLPVSVGPVPFGKEKKKGKEKEKRKKKEKRKHEKNRQEIEPLE